MLTLEDIQKHFPDLSPRRQRQIAAYIDSRLPELKSQAVDDSISMMLSIPVLVLHDKFGFGKVRLSRFLAAGNTWIQAINQDENTMAEILQTAMDEAGFTIETK